MRVWRFYIYMRFKKGIDKPAHNGDVMSKVSFALWPRMIGNEYVLWSRYETLFVYQSNPVKAFLNGEEVVFTIGQWVKVSEKVV